ncbi:MAG TPA: methyltransferase domain-containing protein [Pyrinomonadaceae bacterium]|nr:methyltransferase domain-containing protein [Pyrinomonadaceae bacterium]
MKLCNECGEPIADHGDHCSFCSHQAKKLDGRWAFAPELAEQNDGFEADYFARLAQMEAGNFWFRSRNQLVIWALMRYFPHVESFMEIGCGTGFVLSGIRRALPELLLSGSEIFTAGLSFAAKRLPDVELFQMDARRIPFREEFDVIGAFDVLEHIQEDEAVLAQMYTATRKGGGILITVPHHPFLWSGSDEFARHARRYKTRELCDKVRGAGFHVLRVTSFVSVLLPALILSRFKQRLSTKEFDPTAEFDINSTLNAAFEKLLDGERSMIRAGLSFPAGGSLLLVGLRA